MDSKAANAFATAALSHAKVASLYSSVHARSPITIQPSDDKLWSSSTDPDGTTISVAPTAYPAESLYHELLHAELKLSGYRQHLTFVTVEACNTPMVLAQALDNELQHHRMFPAFVRAGFDAVRFYNDADDKTFASVRSELKRMKPTKTTPAAYFLKYLSIIAPGGYGGEDKRAQLDRYFRMTVPQDKLAKVDNAAAKVLSWGGNTTSDPGPTIVEIIATLVDVGGWWIGASQNFPNDGHFTGAPFTMEDADRFAKS
jgi:hypothetical protein